MLDIYNPITNPFSLFALLRAVITPSPKPDAKLLSAIVFTWLTAIPINTIHIIIILTKLTVNADLLNYSCFPPISNFA